MLSIAIIGRPNVGKSTLFNRLTGTRHAIVHDMPGVTRDRREGQFFIGKQEHIIIDTPGLEESDEEKLEGRMMLQTQAAVEGADLCLMMIDGRAGLTPVDEFFAGWLRRKGKPVITVVNKCEGERGQTGYNDAFRLGFEHVVAISAEHNEGVGELKEIIQEVIGATDGRSGVVPPTTRSYKNRKKLHEHEALGYNPDLPQDDTAEPILQLAIVGRPNTGKSTLLNRLFGSERVLTGPEAGLTRDAIAVDIEIKGRHIKLIDTAGIRKKANITRKLEHMSVGDTLRAIRFCHVAILMLDATQALEKQDLSIADLIEREGRAMVIALNKWDLIQDKEATLKEIRLRLDEIMQQIKGVTVVTLCALEGKNIEKVIDAAFKTYEVWNRRVSTGKMNKWLKDAEQRHIPPLGSTGRRIRLKYITQGNIRPPTFTLFINNPKGLPESYKRYLVNSMREDLDLPGVPIRLMVRSTENPYAEE